ncbi:2'-5' RNA ligase family protein [Microbacterium tenebrionis]|nr:2'-5' RNA ligase family protein [Microbacterium tenebrionis]
MRRPFMNHPDQLASLEGQQYLVLRPTGAVAAEYRATQRDLLKLLPAEIKHPRTEHVTLRGFFEPERRHAVAALVREWAAVQHPIDITVDAIDTFPAPWQIVIMRLARTASLVAAHGSLTAVLEKTDFRRLDELALDDWIFHLSVVYGKTLAPDDWTELERASRRELTEAPACKVAEAELVWYEGGIEHAEVIPLG